MLTKQKLSKTVLENILAKFNLGEIKTVKPLETSGNITYKVENSQEKYLLRLSPSGLRWRSREEITAELELIGYLLGNHFPVGEPVTTKKGEQIVSWKNHFGYLRKFINGDFKSNPTLREVKKFGELVGWFHTLVENYQTKHKRKHLWDLEETKKNFQEDKSLILKSSFKEKEEFVERFEKELLLLNFPKSLPTGLIHEDLGKRHTLWRKGEIVGVIDFDRCYYEKLIFDLGQACRGWCFVSDWSKWSNENFQTLIAGYQQRRNLTTLEKEYLVDAIKFGILERSLSFCLRFIEFTHDKEDQQFALDSLFKLIDLVEGEKVKIEKFLISS